MSTERDELAAVVNGADWTSKSESIADAILTAGYTTRRAVIEELVEKAETEKYPDTYGAFRRAARFHIVEWLRAELEGGDRG